MHRIRSQRPARAGASRTAAFAVRPARNFRVCATPEGALSEAESAGREAQVLCEMPSRLRQGCTPPVSRKPHDALVAEFGIDQTPSPKEPPK